MLVTNMLQLTWYAWTTDVWSSFSTVNLAHGHFDGMEGVYIIWQGGGPIVRVGQGVIKDRIADHRMNPAIAAYNNLYVTWAQVPVQYRDGVERYLANALNPRVGDAFPNALPIMVNLPQPVRG